MTTRCPTWWHRKAAFASLFIIIIALLPGLKAETTAAKEGKQRGILESDAAHEDFRIMQSIFSLAHATAFAQIPKPPLPDLFTGKKNVTIRDFVTRVLGYYRGIQVDHTGLGFSPEVFPGSRVL